MFLTRIAFLFVVIQIAACTAGIAQSISGKLINKSTGQPIAGIRVEVRPGDQVAYTNGLGVFRIIQLKPGTYNIIAISEDQQTALATTTITGSDVSLGEIPFVQSSSSVSEQITQVDVTELAGMENENDNFSSALSAGRDPFVNATTFNLNAGRFRPRGYFNEDAEMLMNGMLMNDQDDGRVLWTAWNALNDVLRNRVNVLNLSESEYTFGGIGGATFIDLRASSQREENKVTYASSNRTFQHRLMATYSTGMMKNGWAIAATASHTYGSQGYIKGTYIQANSYFLAVDRKISDKHLINVVFFGSPQRRGRSTGSFQEMYDIAGTNYYNPNWGYQNGEVRNSREYRIHQPVAMLRHDWKISPRTQLMTNVGYQFGVYGSTRLDWYEAPDPRPDYYRRLPSYANTPEAKDLITSYLTEDDANRQIQWQSLYDANATRNYTINDVNGIPGNTVSGKLAAYVLESENYDNTKFSVNTILNSRISDRIRIAGGFQYLREKVHYYRRLEDLLGADFYVDFNRFALRDFPDNPNAGQNNLNLPNRLVYEGDIYGHNYDIFTHRANIWGQMAYTTAKWDYYAAVQLAQQRFWREGANKVGLFPDNSFGKSEVHSFLNYGLKGGVTYKIDGRNYIVTNASHRTRAPFANEGFVSPRVRDQVVANLQNESISAFDVSYLARYTRFKARISAFLTEFRNKISNDVYYHEEFQTFVNYVMTGIDRRHLGIECGLEYNLNSKLTLTAAGSWGEYYHTSRPLATISRDNSAEDYVQGRVVYINNYYVGGMPQIAGTVGLGYRSSRYWFFNLNVNGFGKNYLTFNPDRRTSEAVASIDPQAEGALFNRIIAEEKLTDAMTVDFSMGKSIRFNNGAFLRINLNAGNILNNTNFRTGGFEQLRFDYVDRNVDKFPPRYFYAYGINYSLNVSYVFPR